MTSPIRLKLRPPIWRTASTNLGRDLAKGLLTVIFEVLHWELVVRMRLGVVTIVACVLEQGWWGIDGLLLRAASVGVAPDAGDVRGTGERSGSLGQERDWVMLADGSEMRAGTRSERAGSKHREVVARLAAAQKPSKGAPAYSRFVNRPLGRQFAAVAFRWGLTPNQVTVASAFFTFTGIALILFLKPTIAAGPIIAVLFVVGYGLDAADGQLARLLGRSSFAGEWLDHMVDATKTVSLHLAVLISLVRFSDLAGSAWLLVPIAYAVVSSVLFFGMTLNDQLRRQHTLMGGEPAAATQTSLLRSLLIIPVDFGFLCLTFMVFGATNWFFAVYTLMFAGSVAYLVLASIKWFGDFSSLDGGRSS